MGVEARKAQIYSEALYKLITEVARDEPDFDFFISKMIWGLSLYLEKGSFAEQTRKNWERQSDAALALAKWRVPKGNGFVSLVAFEHARPIKVMYKMARSEGAALSERKLHEIIGEYPPVYVTCEEKVEIEGKRFKSCGDAPARYAIMERKLPFVLRSERWKDYSNLILKGD